MGQENRFEAHTERVDCFSFFASVREHFKKKNHLGPSHLSFKTWSGNLSFVHYTLVMVWISFCPGSDPRMEIQVGILEPNQCSVLCGSTSLQLFGPTLLGR